jgi:hypothetical protein
LDEESICGVTTTDALSMGGGDGDDGAGLEKVNGLGD